MPFHYTCPVCTKPFTHRSSEARYCSRPCYWEAKRQPLERFWQYVDVCGPDECWQWQACVSSDGYGRFGSSNAHRVAYYLTHECWPEPMGCHTCRNRLCCNPAHIYAGTNHDNMQDRKASGGYRAGKKLNEEIVRIIQNSSASATDLARQFGVTRENIYAIRHKHIWTWVD